MFSLIRPPSPLSPPLKGGEKEEGMTRLSGWKKAEVIPLSGGEKEITSPLRGEGKGEGV